MTIIAPLYITQSPELETALKTKNRAQSNNQKLHTVTTQKPGAWYSAAAKMEAWRFDEEAKSCVLDNLGDLAVLLKQNTQHSRKWTTKKKKREKKREKSIL